MTDFESLLKHLKNHGIDFVIVGGYAVMSHGSTLVTQDLDLCFDLSSDNVLKIAQALKPFNPVHRMPSHRPPFEVSPETATGWENLYLQTDLGVIDCLGEVLGLGAYSEVVKYSVEMDFDDFRCRILSLDGIIRAKEAMDRPKDREAVIQLKAIREKAQES